MKSNRHPRARWAAGLLIACFSVMSVLGTPLHQHDLDPLHLDPDCIPCHLSHSSLSLETKIPELNIPLQVAERVVASTADWFIAAPLTGTSRAPPGLC